METRIEVPRELLVPTACTHFELKSAGRTGYDLIGSIITFLLAHD